MTGLLASVSLATMALPAIADTDSPADNCWQNVGDDGTVTQQVCVNGDESVLEQAILDKYGVVLIWNPATEAAQVARATKYLSKRAKTMHSLTSADPTNTVQPQSAPEPPVSPGLEHTNDPTSADADYVLGELFEKQNYKGASDVYTTSHSASCRKYAFRVPDLYHVWPGEFVWSAHVEKEDIDSFKPGPYCKLGFWFDDNYKGSYYGTYSNNHSDMSWMDDQEDSMWFTG